MNNDLISRKALKEALEVIPYNDLDDLTRTERLIDNASAVDAYPFEQVQELVKLNQQFAQEIENLKRLKGEWKVYGKQGGIPISDICTNCNYETKWFKIKYNYCPECGAQMVNDSVINAIRDNNKRYDERPTIDFDGMQYDLSGEE